MKRYIKELIIFVLQLLAFYILPLFAGPTDIMGLVYLIIITTFTLSLVIGVISNNKIKYLYPIVTAVVFLPTVPIYYNSSALIHSVWYLVVSGVGLLIGLGVNFVINKAKQKK